MTRRIAHLLILLILGTVPIGLVASPALAHASLESEHPHPASVADPAHPPTQVQLAFGENVGASLGAVKVSDPNGNRADTGNVVVKGPIVTEALKPHLIIGTYLVTWRVISADSHVVSGGWSFSIGAVSANKSKINANGDPWTTRSQWIGRLLSQVGVVLFLGSVLFAALLWRPPNSEKRLDRLARSGALVLLVGTALALLMEGPAAGLSPWAPTGSRGRE